MVKNVKPRTTLLSPVSVLSALFKLQITYPNNTRLNIQNTSSALRYDGRKSSGRTKTAATVARVSMPIIAKNELVMLGLSARGGLYLR